VWWGGVVDIVVCCILYVVVKVGGDGGGGALRRELLASCGKSPVVPRWIAGSYSMVRYQYDTAPRMNGGQGQLVGRSSCGVTLLPSNIDGTCLLSDFDTCNIIL